MGGPEDLGGIRVLVVGINYAPEHTGIAPYTTQACDYFAAQGAEVEVFTGVPHYPHWTVPKPLRKRLRVVETRGLVKVRRLRHYVPPKQSALRRGVYEGTFALNVLTQSLPWRPDVVLAVVPSLLGGVAAAHIAHQNRARFIVWVQDLMGPGALQSGISGGDKVAAFAGVVEGWVLRAASEVIVLNEAFRRYTARVGVKAQAVTIQPNWTHIAAPTSPRDAVRGRLGWRDGEIIVLHSGNMGLKQALENVIESAKLVATQNQSVRFVLMGDGSQRAHLQRLGRGIDALSIIPPANNQDFPNILAAADILLVNERASAIDMSLPSKLTSYFRAGRPVIAAVHPEGGTASEVRRSQAGLVVPPEDPTALIANVRQLCSDTMAYAAMQGAATRYADYQLDASRALATLTRTLSPLPKASTAAGTSPM